MTDVNTKSVNVYTQIDTFRVYVSHLLKRKIFYNIAPSCNVLADQRLCIYQHWHLLVPSSTWLLRCIYLFIIKYILATWRSFSRSQDMAIRSNCHITPLPIMDWPPDADSIAIKWLKKFISYFYILINLPISFNIEIILTT